MILIWLGSFAIMLFAMSESQKNITSFFSNLHKHILENKSEINAFQAFLRAVRLVLIEASPQQSLLSGIALYNLKVLDLRTSLVVICLSVLGAWWFMILGLLFLSLNGFFLLGLSFLWWLNWFQSPQAEKFFKWIFFAGLFLIGSDLVLKNSRLLQSLLGNSDLAFFLADGRMESIFVLMAFAIGLNFVIRCEYWSMALGLSLMVANILSLNGALALFVGERIGAILLFWWRSRNVTEEVKSFSVLVTVVSICSLLVGFLFAGEVRSQFIIGFDTDTVAFQNKSLTLMMLIFLVLIFQFMGQMAWGHLYYLKSKRLQ
jgi:hypothetical protein